METTAVLGIIRILNLGQYVFILIDITDTYIICINKCHHFYIYNGPDFHTVLIPVKLSRESGQEELRFQLSSPSCRFSLGEVAFSKNWGSQQFNRPLKNTGPIF